MEFVIGGEEGDLIESVTVAPLAASMNPLHIDCSRSPDRERVVRLTNLMSHCRRWWHLKRETKPRVMRHVSRMRIAHS